MQHTAVQAVRVRIFHLLLLYLHWSWTAKIVVSKFGSPGCFV